MRVLSLALAAVALAGCGPKFDSVLHALGEPVDGFHYVDAAVSYSVPFDCLINLGNNSMLLGEGTVPLGDVKLRRNPRKTLDSDLLTRVDSARIVSSEFETWIWLESLREVKIDSRSWPPARVRDASERQIEWALRKNENSRHRAYMDAPADVYARARVVEYRLQGILHFRIPESFASYALLEGKKMEFYLPFVFSSGQLPGEGAAFVIQGTDDPDRGQFRVEVSNGQYCDHFRNR